MSEIRLALKMFCVPSSYAYAYTCTCIATKIILEALKLKIKKILLSCLGALFMLVHFSL